MKKVKFFYLRFGILWSSGVFLCLWAT